MNNSTDTIAAISTAMSNSGIGIVRISGDDAINIITKIFLPAREKDMSRVDSHTIHYGTIVDENEKIDEALVLVMKAPNSYTREDVVEIDCHGGTFVVNKILETVLKYGARIAEPGEFTKRAFLNGRIDLTQAEAVIDVINAENDHSLKSAVTQLKGSVFTKIKQLRSVLIEQIAYIEAALDDPEHIEMDGYGKTLSDIIRKVTDEVEELIATADDGRIIKEGIKAVILGKPNVGKSSLLNALLGKERAIVTDIAGTTRDALEERLKIKDIVLNIIDTAGIRKTGDVIEQIGVDKAKEYAGEADLIIFMIDASKKLDDNDKEIMSLIKDKKAIILLNKQDLDQQVSPEEIEKMVHCPVILTSIKENDGIDDLADKIREMFYSKEIDFNDQIYITNARQKAALISAKDSLKKALASIEDNMPEDFYTIDLMAGYESLGSVIGETVEDDLADEIFSKFCMGK